jgi:hypothetical protein
MVESRRKSDPEFKVGRSGSSGRPGTPSGQPSVLTLGFEVLAANLEREARSTL